MSISTFGITIWRWASILLIIGALIWTYSVMDAVVTVAYDDQGEAALSVSKETVFYIIMGVFVLNNSVLMSLAKFLKKTPVSAFPLPNRAVWEKAPDQVRQIMVNWVGALVAAINTIFALSLFALATVNSKVYNWDVFSFSWIAYLGAALLVIIVAMLPIQLSRGPKLESDL